MRRPSQPLGISGDGKGRQPLEGDPASPITFGRSPLAGIVHKNSPHEPRSNGDEMRPVLQVYGLASEQPEVDLVHQPRALQRVIRSARTEGDSARDAATPCRPMAQEAERGALFHRLAPSAAKAL